MYWIRRDLRTIKSSFVVTLKLSPIIILATACVIIFIQAIFSSFDIDSLVGYAIILSPISVLGFFLAHVLATKGYAIDTP